MTLQWFVAQIKYSHQRKWTSKTSISSFVTPSKVFVWVETTFARNRHAGFGKPFYERNILTSMVFDRKVLTQSGVAISRKCCFPHGSQDAYRTSTYYARLVDVRYLPCNSWPENHKMHIAHRPILFGWSMCDISGASHQAVLKASFDSSPTPLDCQRVGWSIVRYRIFTSWPENHKMHIAHRPITLGWSMCDIRICNSLRVDTTIVSLSYRWARTLTIKECGTSSSST